MQGVAVAQQHPIGPPWQLRDDGETAYTSVSGAGSDIWGTADSFFFMYQPIEDGEMSVYTRSLDNTDPHAKVGIMFRQTLDAGSVHVILDVQPDGSVEFMTRN